MTVHGSKCISSTLGWCSPTKLKKFCIQPKQESDWIEFGMVMACFCSRVSLTPWYSARLSRWCIKLRLALPLEGLSYDLTPALRSLTIPSIYPWEQQYVFMKQKRQTFMARGAGGTPIFQENEMNPESCFVFTQPRTLSSKYSFFSDWFIPWSSLRQPVAIATACFSGIDFMHSRRQHGLLTIRFAFIHSCAASAQNTTNYTSEFAKHQLSYRQSLSWSRNQI